METGWEQEGGVLRDKCCAYNTMFSGAPLHVTKKLMKCKRTQCEKVKKMKKK